MNKKEQMSIRYTSELSPLIRGVCGECNARDGRVHKQHAKRTMPIGPPNCRERCVRSETRPVHRENCWPGV